MPECNPPVANTFCSVNIHCILSTKERVPMLNPKLREWLWPFLGGGLWRFQCECLPIARNHSLHPKSGRTPSDPNFSPGIPSVAEAASAQFRRQISLGLTKGLTMTSTVPPGRGLSVLLPRHFVPGYYHAVPPGQNTFTRRGSA